ncbi:MAG: VWA domain-containing protein [Bacteriovoracaceae bacterium]|nr:VWA domain-containing protein [Bacteriovoracaceae bacterium]
MEYKHVGYAIIGIAGAIIWTIEYFKIFKRPELHFPQSVQKSRKGSFTRWSLFLLGLISWGLLSFALMQPRKPTSYTENEIEVNDIFFVVDVSKSMLAEDFVPNRLGVAKEKIREFIKMKPADRLGIIMFSERAYTLLPLTTDISLIDQVIDQIKIGFLGSGTNIGDALGLAVAREALSEAKSKVVVLLTDGVSNVGNLTPIEAAKQAKEQGVRVYTIGMGSDKKARMPIGGTNSIFGQRYQYLPGGSYDLKTLKEIADITGAKAYVARDKKALKSVLDTINKLEKTKIKTHNQVVYQELFFNFLLAGVIGLILTESLRKLALKEVV